MFNNPLQPKHCECLCNRQAAINKLKTQLIFYAVLQAILTGITQLKKKFSVGAVPPCLPPNLYGATTGGLPLQENKTALLPLPTSNLIKSDSQLAQFVLPVQCQQQSGQCVHLKIARYRSKCKTCQH